MPVPIISIPFPRNRLRGDRRFWKNGPRTFIADEAKIIPVFGFGQSIDDFRELSLIDEAHAKSDLLQTCNFQTLAMLDGCNIIAGLEQAGLRPRIEPRHAAPE